MRRLDWRNGAENTKLFNTAVRQLGFIIYFAKKGNCSLGGGHNIGGGKLAGMQMVDFLINQPINEKIWMECEFPVNVSSEAPTHIFEECFQCEERIGRP